MPTTRKEKAEAATDPTTATTPHYEIGPIVVGSDGSPGGDDAVALAHELVGTSDRRLVIENIPGVAAPSLGLVGLAEREDAGTLVVGSPHRGPVGRALLGSVAHHVLH
ncbi:MAG: universal stress protein, partial [Actinobacteria bacterium]|nr:universal stress protein [Actinomycetota bacterium]